MRTAINNFLFISSLGVPLIVIALVSPGPFAGRLLPSGIFLLTIGLATSLFYWIKGKKADQEYSDERSNYIFEKSAKFTFYVMAIFLQVHWAYNFSIVGNSGDNLFILLAVFWGSLLIALFYNLRRV